MDVFWLWRSRGRAVDGRMATQARDCDRGPSDEADGSAYLSVEVGGGGRVVDLCLAVCDQ